MMNFQQPRRVRRMPKANTGRIRGGKLYPVMMHKVKGSESGTLTQRFSLELDPIPGRLISEMFVEMYDIFVPVQAMDAIKDPAAAYAGMTEVVREKLLSGTPLFPVEAEGTISRTAKVNPKMVSNVKYVTEACRLAYNCAVNMLRQRRYFRATQVLHSNTAILPAILAETVLDKINGVLDPDDRINGSFQLEIPNMVLPVRGLGFQGTTATTTAGRAIRESEAASDYTTSASDPDKGHEISGSNLGTGLVAQIKAGTSGATARPDISAIFDGSLADQSVSLTDFYNAQKMDEFARIMDQMMRDNPQYGEEMVLRWAHGLSVDAGRMPFILAERRVAVNKGLKMATDTTGIEDDVLRTDAGVQIGVTIPIPKTELGGIIITLVCLKPDEALASQPEPFLSEAWTADNYVADSLELDPQPVRVRDLYSDCLTADENNIVAYTGLNGLLEYYVDYGFSRITDLADVEAKTAIWQMTVPLSVNPDNVNYPDYLDHGVFAFGGTEEEPEDVATFTIMSLQTSPTPIIFGPTPIEDVGAQNVDIIEGDL